MAWSSPAMWLRRILGVVMIFGGIAGCSAWGSSDMAWVLIIGGAGADESLFPSLMAGRIQGRDLGPLGLHGERLRH